MNAKYFIHNPEHWGKTELSQIQILIGSNYKESSEAAVGEGAGGTGLDTVVEVLLTSPISTGLLSAALYDLVKLLWSHRPNKRPAKQEDLPARYKLVVHTSDGIIVINLDDNIADIEIALKSVPNLSGDKKSRAYQNGKQWDVF